MLDHTSLYILESHDHQQVLNAVGMEKVLTQFFDPRWSGLLDGEVIPVDSLFVLKRSHPNYSKLRAEALTEATSDGLIPTEGDWRYWVSSSLDTHYFVTFSKRETSDLVAGLYPAQSRDGGVGGWTSHMELVWTHSRD